MKHYKLRPGVVRIMGRNYAIVWEDDPILTTDNLGVCRNQQCIIAIREGQHPVEEADTLLHEIFHAIWYVMSISDGGAAEEQVVRRLASGMLQVILDNPHVLKYFAAIKNPDHIEL